MAENENSELKSKVADLEQRASSLQEEVSAAQSAKSELDDRLEGLEKENRETADQLVDAYNRIKSEEGMRDKAKEALTIALSLLAGEVEDNGVPHHPDA